MYRVELLLEQPYPDFVRKRDLFPLNHDSNLKVYSVISRYNGQTTVCMSQFTVTCGFGMDYDYDRE